MSKAVNSRLHLIAQGFGGFAILQKLPLFVNRAIDQFFLRKNVKR